MTKIAALKWKNGTVTLFCNPTS